MGNVFIYGLYDPRNGEIRYVGKTIRGLSRPRASHGNYCLNWEKQLESLGLKKEIRILEEWDGVSDRTSWLNERERFWIAHHRTAGAKLTNLTNGGEGACDDIPFETRKKMSESMKGKNVGKIRSEETRKKLSEAHKGQIPWIAGKKHTNETLEKLRSSHTGKKHSEETKQKMSESHKGLFRSEETKRKIAEAQRARWSKRKEKCQNS